MSWAKKYPDWYLINEANNIDGNKFPELVKPIDNELENRYLDFAEELYQYEEWQELDDAILSLKQ